MISKVSPASFNIPNTGSASISFSVTDELNHPLASGTSIVVTAEIPPPPIDGAEQNKVFLTFGQDGKLSLGDAIMPGAGTTDFTMLLQDGTWGINDIAGTPVVVTITVTGPNASAPVVWTINGVVH
jgi:hypothetical protein